MRFSIVEQYFHHIICYQIDYEDIFLLQCLFMIWNDSIMKGFEKICNKRLRYVSINEDMRMINI